MAATSLHFCRCFKFLQTNRIQYRILKNLSVPATHQQVSDKSDDTSDEFRVYEIKGVQKQVRGKKDEIRRFPIPPARYTQMHIDQDWTNVWPTAQTFKWSVIPFPVRQGFIKNSSENSGIPPGRYANAELMKIPNFLHLTPGHIKKHCVALKKYCTPWPKGLETDEACSKHFPVRITSADYCHAGPSIRDMRARTVQLKIKLSSLTLDHHARDKMLRLARDRYDEETDVLTIIADKCPLKKQNYDYAMYLLTALYYEAWKTEAWEAEKTVADHELYIWDANQSRKTMLELIPVLKKASSDSESESAKEISEEDIVNMESVKEYSHAVTDMNNSGEDSYSINKYKLSVLKLLNMNPTNS